MLTVGSLFSGVGGIDLGLERAGMKVLWQCEIDPYCRKVLSKHWPDVHCYEDVRKIDETTPKVDLICGGFPCQPVSTAGKRQAEADSRWLWPEFARIVGLLRPRYVLVENVPGLLTKGMGFVLADFSSLGYDAEWGCVSAADVGAPHLRNRVFIIAHTDRQGSLTSLSRGLAREEGTASSGCGVANPSGSGQREGQRNIHEGQPDAARRGADLADTPSARCGEGRCQEGGALRDEAWGPQPERRSSEMADAEGQRCSEYTQQSRSSGEACRTGSRDSGRSCPEVFVRLLDGTERPICESDWTVEPNVGRVAYGVPARVDRLRSLGNAVVPQVAEHVGRQIMGAVGYGEA